jgi:hypothetical protein
MAPKISVRVQVRWRADSGREACWRQLATLLLARVIPSQERGRAMVEPGDERQIEPDNQSAINICKKGRLP